MTDAQMIKHLWTHKTQDHPWLADEAGFIREAVARAGVPAEQIEDVWFGAANQAGEDNRNVARMALLLAGLPDRIPGATVNRLCASSLEACITGARAIASGEMSLVIAGGCAGHAFKFGPALGELVADLLEGRPRPGTERFALDRPALRGARAEATAPIVR